MCTFRYTHKKWISCFSVVNATMVSDLVSAILLVSCCVRDRHFAVLDLVLRLHVSLGDQSLAIIMFSWLAHSVWQTHVTRWRILRLLCQPILSPIKHFTSCQERLLANARIFPLPFNFFNWLIDWLISICLFRPSVDYKLLIYVVVCAAWDSACLCRHSILL